MKATESSTCHIWTFPLLAESPPSQNHKDPNGLGFKHLGTSIGRVLEAIKVQLVMIMSKCPEIYSYITCGTVRFLTKDVLIQEMDGVSLLWFSDAIGLKFLSEEQSHFLKSI